MRNAKFKRHNRAVQLSGKYQCFRRHLLKMGLQTYFHQYPMLKLGEFLFQMQFATVFSIVLYRQVAQRMKKNIWVF